MTGAERFQRAMALFDQVCDLPPSDRDKALSELCGDDAALRREVQSLIDHDGPARGAVEAMDSGHGVQALAVDIGSHASRNAHTDKPQDLPERIGPYRILRKVGQGGMGIIYEAQQDHPRRRVALKVIQPGFAGEMLLKRFQLEANLLGQLQHPGIAHIYEASVDETSGVAQPFLAMEFIDGQPLDRYADNWQFSFRQRLELVARVADAVQYAHQKGIIHRDLKPPNILVVEPSTAVDWRHTPQSGGTVDALGQPKILDFGIARATDADLQAVTIQTQMGQLVGTLEYMSPEQVGGNSSEVDARSDVYALGVILYQLLTGRLPLPLRGRSIAECSRIIQEDEPPRAGALQPEARGDVETIVAKAMDKNPQRRYDSAAELAADLRRYLRSEPISARPASALYQIRKFAGRNRALVGGAATALIAILVGSGFAIRYALLANRQANAAHAAAISEREARAVADARFEEIIRLSDHKRLANARAEAEQLWPAVPGKAAAMRAWMAEKAQPLRDNYERHRETLEALRSRALPYTKQDRQADLENHPMVGELERQQLRLQANRSELEEARTALENGDESAAQRVADLEELIQTREASVDEWEREVARRRTWRFADDAVQWQHDTLADLVAGLRTFLDPDPFNGAVASVESRLKTAESIEERSTTGRDVATAWQDAIADIGKSVQYGGLDLSPQLGLVPLHRDPRSGLWEFWHVESGDRPQPNPDSSAHSAWQLGGDMGMVFVLLPGGKCLMGAQNEDPDAPRYDPAEHVDGPVHEIELAPFFLSKYEVTQAQWERLTGDNPSAYDWQMDWYGNSETPLTRNTKWNPVEQVTALACDRVLARLGLLLPTEAQWEFATRGGSDSPWWTGSDPESIGQEQAGNIADGWTKRNGGPTNWVYEEWLDDGYAIHAPVGSFAPNAFGLHDVIGNVSEMCRDMYGPYPGTIAEGTTDGFRQPQDNRYRVHRGASFRVPAPMARSSVRMGLVPEDSDHTIGLRPVRRVEP